ncbi:MAG: SpoIIE family protein phosphatase [Candidatus Brocadiae bacterium]|nr:SpoIIE family protein phosphatase [Candidatus Brocadiia bacterium]
MSQLIIMDGTGVGTTFELGKMNILGKSEECNVRLSFGNIEEQHAKIYPKGDTYFIAGIGTSEVQVNGHIIHQERKLIHGDMITLGNTMLLYGEENIQQQEAKEELQGLEKLEEEPEKQLSIKSRQKFYKTTEIAIQSLSQTKEAPRHIEVLLKVSNAIISKLELKELLSQILDIIFEHLPADRGTVFLRDPKANRLWPMASKRRKEIKGSDKVMGSRTIIKEVLETKEGILTKDAMEDQRFQMGASIAAQQIHAAICVPVVGKNEEVLGIIHLDCTRTEKIFGDDHLRLVTAIAMQSALAIENALLVQELGEKKRIEQEINIASNIQKELLPKFLPTVPGIEVYGFMRPAKEVGGDYYDFIPTGDNSELYICIGDVSGKGVPAGLVMVMARCFLRPLVLSNKNTKKILDELNKLLVADTRKDMFMSMLIMKWDVFEKKFYWTGAGHEHILIYRAKTKTCECIRTGGIVLGMIKKAEKFFKEESLYLDSKDMIVLYTDGVTECFNAQGQMLELEAVKKLVEKYGHLPVKDVCNSLLAELQRFMGKASQYDDITIVGIKKT